jgi:16S rRNA (guanine527-N7)-methyltransferase
MQLILKYFPDLDQEQTGRYEKLLEIIPLLNERVNIISRRDIGSLEERHILHSLAIAKKFSFDENTTVIDVGTGGGFPGIPLAILFPDTSFTLVDSIGKKTRVVQEISEMLGLDNVSVLNDRMENLELRANFVVSRAVAGLPQLYRWSVKLIRTGRCSAGPNGLISLKGGDLEKELKPFRNRTEVFPISTWFEESFFYLKKIVYLKK